MANKIEIYLNRKSSNIAENTSVIDITVKCYSELSWSNYACSGFVKVDGKVHNFTHTFGTGTTTIYHATQTVSHNADGTKVVEANGEFRTETSIGTLRATKSLKLQTIPRATTPKLNYTGQTFGNPIRISLPAHSSSFRHNLSYRMLGKEEVFAEGITASYFDWPVPVKLMNEIPNRTAVTITIICKTLSAGNTIGTKTTSFTAKVPAAIKPTVKVDITEAVNNVKNIFGKYVQGESKLNIKVTGEGSYNSTIKEYATTIAGITYNSATFTSNKIRNSGKISIVAKVKDSRGRSESITRTIDVATYRKPEITLLSSERCDPDGTTNDEGTSIKVRIKGAVTNLKGNIKALTLRYKNITDLNYSEKTINVVNWDFDEEIIVNSTKSDESYLFEAVLTDALYTVTERAQTGHIIMSRLAGGKGVKFFGEASKEGFFIKNTKFPFEIFKDNITSKNVTTGSTFTTLLEIPIPAGSYMVFGNCGFTNPFEAFKTARITVASGIWEQRVQSIGQLKGAMSVSDVLQLDASDTVRLQILHGAKQSQKAEGTLKIVKFI